MSEARASLITPWIESPVLVTGSGTEVGKTWVTAAVAGLLTRVGHRIAVRKPVQSYEPGEGRTDAEVLAAATGELSEEVCAPQRWYPLPMAPPMAAAALGYPAFTVADLVADLRPPGIAHWFVEGVGGVRSPIADDGDTATLAEALAPCQVVFVVESGLGAINSVLLARDALRHWPLTVFLNRFRPDVPVHPLTAAWLADREGIRVTTTIDDLAAHCVRVWNGHAPSARAGD